MKVSRRNGVGFVVAVALAALGVILAAVVSQPEDGRQPAVVRLRNGEAVTTNCFGEQVTGKLMTDTVAERTVTRFVQVETVGDDVMTIDVSGMACSSATITLSDESGFDVP